MCIFDNLLKRFDIDSCRKRYIIKLCKHYRLVKNSAWTKKRSNRRIKKMKKYEHPLVDVIMLQKLDCIMASVPEDPEGFDKQWK